MKELTQWEGSYKVTRPAFEGAMGTGAGDVITSDKDYTPDFYVLTVKENGEIWGYII